MDLDKNKNTHGAMNDLILGTAKNPDRYGAWALDRYQRRPTHMRGLSLGEFYRMLHPESERRNHTRTVHVHVDGVNYGLQLHVPPDQKIEDYVGGFLGPPGWEVTVHSDNIVEVHTPRGRKLPVVDVAVVSTKPIVEGDTVEARERVGARCVGEGMPKLIPIEDVAGIPTQTRSVQIAGMMSRVGAEMPKLVPIEDPAVPRIVPTTEDEIPRLVPITGHMDEMPALVPITEHTAAKRAGIPVPVAEERSRDEMPGLIPITERVAEKRSEMPALVPIEVPALRREATRAEIPDLVPMEASAPRADGIKWTVGPRRLMQEERVDSDVPELEPIPGTTTTEAVGAVRGCEHLTNFKNAIKSFSGAIDAKVGTPPKFDLRDRNHRRVVFAYTDAAFAHKRTGGIPSLSETLIAKAKSSPTEYAAALYSLFSETVAERPAEWTDAMSFEEYVEKHGRQSGSKPGTRSVELESVVRPLTFVVRVDGKSVSVVSQTGSMSTTTLDLIAPACSDYPGVVLFQMFEPFSMP